MPIRFLKILIISYAPVKPHLLSAGVRITTTSPTWGVEAAWSVGPVGLFWASWLLKYWSPTAVKTWEIIFLLFSELSSLLSLRASLSIILVTSSVVVIGVPSGRSITIATSSASRTGKNCHFTHPPASKEKDIKSTPTKIEIVW